TLAAVAEHELKEVGKMPIAKAAAERFTCILSSAILLSSTRPGSAFVGLRMLPVLPVLVVLLSLFRVTEHFVGFIDFLEFSVCLLVVRVQVRVIFPGQLTVSVLDLRIRGVLAHAENLIIIYILHCT